MLETLINGLSIKILESSPGDSNGQLRVSPGLPPVNRHDRAASRGSPSQPGKSKLAGGH